MSNSWNDPSMPPSDGPVADTPMDAPPKHVISADVPPVGGFIEQQPGQPWWWGLFGALIVGLMALQLLAYFQPGEDGVAGPSVSADTKLTLKMYAAMRSLGTLAGSSAASSDEQATEMLTGVEKNLLQDGIQDAEEARYVAAVQGALGKEINEEALGLLQDSPEEIDQLTAGAVTGDSAAAEGLDARSDDPAERIAHGLALKAGGNEKALASLMSGSEVLMTFAGPMLFIGLLGMGVIVLIGYGIMAATGGLKPAVGFPQNRINLFAADVSAFRAAAFLLLYFFVAQGVVAGALVLSGVDQGFSFLMAQVVGTMILIGIGLIPLRDRSTGLWTMIVGEDVSPVWKLAGAGLLGYVANFPIFLTVTVISQALGRNLPEPSHAIAEQMSQNPTLLTTVFLFFAAAVFAPFLEEVVFRGWLLRGLMTRTGKVWLSIFVSGMSFAVIHPQGPVLYGALGCIGMMGAFLTYRTGSLIPAMVMHAFHNGTILIIGQLML